MNENQFELEGKTFVAVQEHEPCEGCAFEERADECWKLREAGKIPPCNWKLRKDGIATIFVEKDWWKGKK